MAKDNKLQKDVNSPEKTTDGDIKILLVVGLNIDIKLSDDLLIVLLYVNNNFTEFENFSEDHTEKPVISTQTFILGGEAPEENKVAVIILQPINVSQNLSSSIKAPLVFSSQFSKSILQPNEQDSRALPILESIQKEANKIGDIAKVTWLADGMKIEFFLNQDESFSPEQTELAKITLEKIKKSSVQFKIQLENIPKGIYAELTKKNLSKNY